MARLQILELPEGSGDDRPPFVLVIDQVPADEDKFDAIRRDLLSDGDLAPRLGARAVLVFEETIEIPANAPLPLLDETPDAAEQAGTTQIVYAHERTRLDLCAALMLSGDTTWRQLVAEAAELQRTIARILNLPEQPQAVVPGKPSMEEYLHGYGVGVRAAKRAARNEPARVAEDGG